MRKTDIEAGTTEFVEKFEAVSIAETLLLDYLLWTHASRGGFQLLQSHEPPPPRRTTEHEIKDIQPPEANEAPSIRRLDGEVTRLEEIAFAAGTYCEVWEGRWAKGGGEKAEVEKVSLNLTAFILLIRFFVGSLESTSHA